LRHAQCAAAESRTMTRRISIDACQHVSRCEHRCRRQSQLRGTGHVAGQAGCR
jgi:hypothetical protein